MKVLCVTEDLGSGGAQRQLVTLALNLVDHGHEVTFLIYVDNNFYSESVISKGINIVKVLNYTPLKRILRIRKEIRDNNYDVIISFLIGPSFACAIAGFPSRNWKWCLSERGSAGLKYSFKTRVQRQFHRFADIITTNSHTNLNYILKSIPFLKVQKCRVIYNAIDLNIWMPNGQYNLNNSRRILIVAASHHWIKNGLGLLEALNRLTEDEKKRIIVHWYGELQKVDLINSSLKDEQILLSKYNLQDVIRYFPATGDLNNKMRTADCVGLFSFDEGLPNALCEGMACGKPIVSSQVSDIPLFIEDNVNGFLCDARKVDSIVDSLRRFIYADVELLRNMGLRNRAKAVELFDKGKIVQEYLDLITQ